MTTEQRLQALLEEKVAPAIAQAFMDAIADINDNVILQQVIDAVERGDIDGAYRALGITPPVYNRIMASLAGAFEQFGQTVMASFPRVTKRRRWATAPHTSRPVIQHCCGHGFALILTVGTSRKARSIGT